MITQRIARYQRRLASMLERPGVLTALAVVVALTAGVYLLPKGLFASAFSLDFKFFWLAGEMWERGENPYTSAFAALENELFPIPQPDPVEWYYPPNWWPICRVLALFAVILFSAAMSVKLQAIFLLPVLLFFLLNGRRYGLLLALPFLAVAVYMTLNLPYLLSGRPALETLLIYPDQAGYYERISKGAPNFLYAIDRIVRYAWSDPTAILQFISTGALVVASILGGAIALVGAKGKINLTLEQAVIFALFVLLIFPFILPKMHDRYFFPADVFALLLFFVNRRYFALALTVQCGSLFAYSDFLDTFTLQPLMPDKFAPAIGSVFMMTALALTVHSAFQAGLVQKFFGGPRCKALE